MIGAAGTGSCPQLPRGTSGRRATCNLRTDEEEEEIGGYWWLLVETAGSGARAARASRRLRLRPGCGRRPRLPRRGARRSNGQSRVRGRRVDHTDGRRHELSPGLDDEPIVAACAMTLVEDCTLRLDHPVDDLLPELADMTVLADPHGPLEDTVAAQRPITLRDLLTYT